MLALYLCGLAASPRVRDALTPHERLDQAAGRPLAGKCKALQEGITDEWCETNYASFPKFCKCEGAAAVDPVDAAKAAADEATAVAKAAAEANAAGEAKAADEAKAVAKAAADANAAAAVPAKGQPLPDTPPQAGGATGSVQQPAPKAPVSAQQPAPEAPVSAQQPAPEAPVSAQQPAPVGVPVTEVPQAAPVAEPAAVASAVPEITIGSDDAAATTASSKEASYCGSAEMDAYFNKKCGNSVISVIAECCDEKHVDEHDDRKCDAFRMACIKGHIESGECTDPFDCDDGCQFYDGLASTCCPHVRARKLAVAPAKAVDWATGAELPQATSAQYDAPLDEAAMKKAIAKAQAENQAAAAAEAQAAPVAIDPAAEAMAAAHDAARANAEAAAAAKKASTQAHAAAGGGPAGEPAKAVDWATGKELPQAPTAQYDAPLDEAAMRDSIKEAEAANAAASESVAANIPEPQPTGEDTGAEFNPNDPASKGAAPHQRPAPTQTPDDYCGSPAHAAHFDELCSGKLLDIMADCCTQECIYHWKCAKRCDEHRRACSRGQVEMGVCTDPDDCDMGVQVFNQVTDSCCRRDPPPLPPPSSPPPARVCERHDRKKQDEEWRRRAQEGRLEFAP
jgi:hypothetical protein